VPLFALANAGVALNGWNGWAGPGLAGALTPVSAGVALGLLVGKPLGIALGAWLAVRLGLAELPGDLTWRHVLGMGCLGGIGFTMALFIAQLAFPPGTDAARWLEQAKLGVLAGSLLSGLTGCNITRPPSASPAARMSLPPLAPESGPSEPTARSSSSRPSPRYAYIRARNSTRVRTSSAPSRRPTVPLAASAQNSSEIPSMKGISRRTIDARTRRGRNSAARARISPTFAMLLPTTFPTARSGVPLRAARRLTASSGADVPKATSVSPITSRETPSPSARRAEPRTKPSAPT